MTVWLRSNTRALCLGMVLPLAGLLTGLALFTFVEHPAARILGGLLVALGSALAIFLLWQMRIPRLAHDRGHLLVYLQIGRPIRVPLEIVECFLLGQSPTMLPGKHHEHSETSSVVIRLSETAEDWRHRDVKPALGKWCDGYITLRGTWCEPLNVQVVHRLNASLAEAQQSARPPKVAS